MTRYDRRSAAVVLTLVVGGLAAGHRWQDLIDVRGEFDLLLAFLWLWIAAAIPWNIRWRHDIVLLLVGLIGGGLIETWGTRTNVWFYYTQERPPLWIIPAWSTAALTVDRNATALWELSSRIGKTTGWSLPKRWPWAYWAVLPGFAMLMVWFSSGRAQTFDLLIAAGVMIGVIVFRPQPSQDLVLFVAGSVLGIVIETWGTSRRCWTYYTYQVPPPVAILAHGFASVAFVRAATVVERLMDLAAVRLRSAQSQSS